MDNSNNYKIIVVSAYSVGLRTDGRLREVKPAFRWKTLLQYRSRIVDDRIIIIFHPYCILRNNIMFVEHRAYSSM